MTDIPIAAFRFSADTSQALRATSDLHTRVKGFGDLNFSSLDSSLGGLTKGFAALLPVLSAAAVVGFAKTTIDWADNLGDAAERAGITAESMSRLAFAAEQSDVAFNDLESGIKRFQKTLSEAALNGDSVRSVFTDLGLSARTLKESTPENQLAAIADAFAQIENPADRTRVAMELFGKGGAELIPLLMKGSAGIRELTEAAVALDDRAVASIDRATKSFDSLWFSLKAGTANLIGQVIGAFRGTGDEISDLTNKLEHMKKVRDALVDSDTIFSRMELRGFQKEIAALETQVSLLKQKNELKAKDKPTGALKSSLDSDELQEVGKTGVLADEKIRRDAAFRASQTFGSDTVNKEFELEDRLAQRKRIEQDNRKEDARFQQDLEREITQTIEEENQRRTDAMIASSQVQIETQINATDVLRDLAGGRAAFEIDLEQFKNQSFIAGAAQLLGGFLTHNKKHAKAAKAIAYAQTIWATSRAIMEAAPVVPLMALAAGAGALNLAKIAQTNYSEEGSTSGGGGFSTGGGGFSTAADQRTVPAATPAAAAERSMLQVIVQGNVIGNRQFVEELMFQIRDAVDQRDVILITPSSRQAKELAA